MIRSTGKTHRRLVEDKVPLETALMLVHTDFREQASGSCSGN